MSHIDADTLTLLALGEESEGVRGHLAGCGTCSADLASLRRTVVAGRAIDPSERAPAPPSHLWDRIAAELDLAPSQAPAAENNGHRPAKPAEPLTASEATPPDAEEPAVATATAEPEVVAAQAEEQASADVGTDDEPVAPPHAPVASAQGGVTPGRLVDVGGASGPRPAEAGPRDGRPPVGPRSRARASKRRRTSLVGGALMGLVALAAVLTFVLSSARPRVVAEAALAPLEGSSLEGSAQLVERDGALELRVDLAAASETDRYYELWLLDTSGEGLVSLGPVAGDGVHPLPAGLTVADFPVVDVSSERFDGDPGHSGDSLSRGTLPV